MMFLLTDCVGVHENQLYIQPSVHMMRKVEAIATDALQQGSVDMPRVRWNPYIITGLSAVLCNKRSYDIQYIRVHVV